MKIFSFGSMAAMFVMAIGIGIFEPQPAGGAMTLQAELMGKAAHGQALYVEYALNKRAFFATLEGVTPNADLRITLRRGSTFKKITTLQADQDGNAEVTLYLSIPQLKPDDLLEVWQEKGNLRITSGRMGLVGTEGN